MTDTTCPSCDAPAPARARACPACGYRFLEDQRAGRPRGQALLLLGAALAAAALVVVLSAGDGETPRGEPRVAFRQVVPELLSAHPLSAHALERRLEARFTSERDDDSAAASCSAREPRPAHAIRHCRIRYPNGVSRGVVVLLDARGRELLSEY